MIFNKNRGGPVCGVRTGPCLRLRQGRGEAAVNVGQSLVGAHKMWREIGPVDTLFIVFT